MKKTGRIKQKVNLNLPPELNQRWIKVAKKHGLVRSRMVEEFLELILPTLESDDKKTMIESALDMSKQVDKDKKVLKKELDK